MRLLAVQAVDAHFVATAASLLQCNIVFARLARKPHPPREAP